MFGLVFYIPKAATSRKFDRFHGTVYLLLDKDTKDLVLESFAPHHNNGDLYLLFHGISAFKRYAKAGKIITVKDNFIINTTYSNNIGICCENTIIDTLDGFRHSTTEEDRQGIDGFYYDIPVQIKSAVHGLTGLTKALDGDFSQGISSINCTLTELDDIFNKM